MDYCSDCRRHLNGALACPGCGAYAPSIAPLADGTPATVTAGWQAPSQLWHNAEPDAEEFDEAPQEHPYNGPDSPSRRRRAGRHGVASGSAGGRPSAGPWWPPRSPWSAAA